jgi:hypothetical protein
MIQGFNISAIESFLLELLGQLTALDILILVIAFILLLSSPLLAKYFHGGNKAVRAKIGIFRALNILIIGVMLFYHLLVPNLAESWVLRAISSFVTIYFAYLLIHITSFFIKRRYGRKHEDNGEVLHTVTYHSRLLSLIAGTLITIVALIAVIRILGFESLLEAGGVLGVIGVILALSQASWAPDLIAGLIILNSSLVEEGDVIEISGNDALTGSIFKTKIFHTEILNLANNHRVMIRNTQLRNYAINNLSKFTSARGLREKLVFKIGYEVPPEKVRDFFLRVYESASKFDELSIEKDCPFEVSVADTADYAVVWSLGYYTKDVKSVLKTRVQLRELVLKMSFDSGIQLATPTQLMMQNEVAS